MTRRKLPTGNGSMPPRRALGIPTIVDWGRELLGDLETAGRREWLVTNGIGGFASGTVAGSLARRYHGLLIAALMPPLGRTLLVSKVDETVEYDGLVRALGTNRWAGGAVEPHGYRELERFQLVGTTAVWTYAVADALVEKRIWKEQGANTTYVRYRLLRGRVPVALRLDLTVNYRDYHATTRAEGWRMEVTGGGDALRVQAFPGSVPFVLRTDRGRIDPAHVVPALRAPARAGPRARGGGGSPPRRDGARDARARRGAHARLLHREGTRHGIGVDPADGLLRSGEPGVQLTWMDAKVGDWVVTPRTGKAVEVNALWYGALAAMADFTKLVGRPGTPWESEAERVATGFGRFWNERNGYCYDVLDTPSGHDDTLRPNQLLAVALPDSPLSHDRQRRVLEACARALVTSHGLRSLATGHPDYRGRYGGSPRERDGAYHQGTVWGWLLGPFALAHRRVHGDAAAARAWLGVRKTRPTWLSSAGISRPTAK